MANKSRLTKLAHTAAADILANPQIKAHLRAHLIELVSNANAQDKEITEARRVRRHEKEMAAVQIELAKIRAVSDTANDFAAKVNHVIDARLQKERNGAK